MGLLTVLFSIALFAAPAAANSQSDASAAVPLVPGASAPVATDVSAPASQTDADAALWQSTECNTSYNVTEEPSCVWRPNDSPCNECAGVCVTAAPADNVQLASQMAGLAMSACGSLAAQINAYGMLRSNAAAAPLTCPSNADVTSNFEATLSAMKETNGGRNFMSNSSFSVFQVYNSLLPGVLDSADSLIQYFGEECVNKAQGTDPETFACESNADAAANFQARTEEVFAMCAAAQDRLKHGSCLSFYDVTHIDRGCLMAHELSVVGEEMATDISTAFSALHTTCSNFTTEEACNDADAAAAQVAAATASIANVPLPTGSASAIASATWVSITAVAALAAVIL